jgi:hypothetical protein
MPSYLCVVCVGLFHVSDLYPTLLSLASPHPPKTPPSKTPTCSGDGRGVDHWPALLQAWVGEGEGLEALPRQCLHAVYGVEGTQGEEEGDQKQCPPGHVQRHTIASFR